MMKRVHPLPPSPGVASVRHLGTDPLHGPMTLVRDYGPLVYLPVGPGFAPIYVVGEPEMVEQVLVKERDKYIKDRYLRWMTPIFGNSILVSEGDHWRRSRRLMAPAFHRRALQHYGDVMVRATNDALDRLDLSRGFASNRWSMELTLDIVLECLFGAELGDKGPRVAKALDDLMIFADHIVGRVVPPWEPWPTKASRAVERGMRAIHEVIDEIIAERHKSSEEHEDLLAMLLGSRDEDGTGLSDEEVREEVITLMLAGHETTALTIAYALMLLGWNPGVVEKAQAELDAVVGDRVPTMQDLPNLPYNEQIVKEALRMYPPASIIARQTIEEDEIAGYPIPVGAQVTIPIWGLHHDERWYPRPYHFEPERWTPELEKSRPRYSFVAFGGGNRVCIGEAFARMEARLVLARVLQLFHPKTLIETPPKMTLSITLRPNTDIPVELQPRR